MHVSPPHDSNVPQHLLAFYERIATRLTVALVVLLAVLPPAVLAIAYVLLMAGLVFLATCPRASSSNGDDPDDRPRVTASAR